MHTFTIITNYGNIYTRCVDIEQLSGEGREIFTFWQLDNNDQKRYRCSIGSPNVQAIIPDEGRFDTTTVLP